MDPLARGLLAGTVLVLVLGEVRVALRRRRDATVAGWGGELVFRLLVGAGAGAAILAMHQLPGLAMGHPNAVASASLVLLWCGIALRHWSFHTLGRYFTFVVQTTGDQEVVTTGPYRFVRHPSYAALLLYSAGLGLFTANWASVLVLPAVIAVALAYRIRIEERALRGLGAAYAEYAATHKRLVPHVW